MRYGTVRKMLRDIGKEVKDARMKLGMTQTEAATEAKVSRVYVTMLESGDLKNATIKMLHKICTAVDIDFDVSLVVPGESKNASI
jgi:transcriptional regulator with XRE-family HTH domain